MAFIVRDDYNKMVAIRKVGFATVPYGGKKPPGIILAVSITLILTLTLMSTQSISYP